MPVETHACHVRVEASASRLNEVTAAKNTSSVAARRAADRRPRRSVILPALTAADLPAIAAMMKRYESAGLQPAGATLARLVVWFRFPSAP